MTDRNKAPDGIPVNLEGMTVAEYIRKMSDAELATFLWWHCTCRNCGAGNICDALDSDSASPRAKCHMALQIWLKSKNSQIDSEYIETAEVVDEGSGEWRMRDVEQN